jgi:hypothetical protein
MIAETLNYLMQPENIAIAVFLGYVITLTHLVGAYVLTLCLNM